MQRRDRQPAVPVDVTAMYPQTINYGPVESRGYADEEDENRSLPTLQHKPKKKRKSNRKSDSDIDIDLDSVFNEKEED